MYHIPYFKETERKTVIDFMKQHPFVMLIGCDDLLPVATQVPVLMEEKEEKLFLYGHIMKSTDHHKSFLQNPNALCVFTGAHTYVSGSWYSNPKTASTWNYISVQAKGTIKFLDDASLVDILEKTTTLFENNNQSPASFHQLPKEYVDKLMKAIVAFEIEVTGLENVFKLSQNRDEESYINIIKNLQEGDTQSKSVALEMEQRFASLFHK